MEYDFDQDLEKMLFERTQAVRENIADACAKAGRDVNDVTLIGVSKVFPVSYAEAAFCSGLKDLGENRVQEFVPKQERLKELGLEPNWHLIGTLQKNKVKYIIGKTYLIHSVNTIELAQEISKRSEAAGIVTDILMQANVSGEESKHGFSPEELKGAVEAMNALEGIRLCGMMTMAPIEQYEGQARKVFADTQELYRELSSYVRSKDSWKVLSMGMSHDYTDAIAEGATHIRIGTSIFGDRSTVNN